MMNHVSHTVGIGQVETPKAQPPHDSTLEEFQVSFMELLGETTSKPHSFCLFFVIWGRKHTFIFPSFWDKNDPLEVNLLKMTLPMHQI